MSDQLHFDEAQSRAVEAVYAFKDVVEQRRLTLAALELAPGERVLDIGCGPGYLAAEMAETVGAGGLVRGVDPSAPMLGLAARREPSGDAARIELSEGDALSLPVPDSSFDVAVSTQVYEYVADIPAALAEARRALRPGGRILILDTDWDSIVWRSSDDERMARVLSAWDEHLAHRDLPRHLPQLLDEGGFKLSKAQVVPMLNVGYDRASYSAGVLGLIADFVIGRHEISEESARAWAADLSGLGPHYFFSLSRYLFVAEAR
ncbi:MAG TPA: methyltransferase domain-containing protein [Thermoleophilaceae bacterium]|jgi:ubiquinone/menaquinone biosynthesis C-methylase UbiE